MPNPKFIVEIDYVNWKGERAKRLIVPGRVHFGVTEWHPEEQYLLDAHDVEKDAQRTFALKDIGTGWKPVA